MFNFTDLISQATQLFHSPNVDELMNPDGVADLSAILADAGLDLEMLAGPTPDEILAKLSEAGVDPAALSETSMPEQIQALIGR